MATTIAAHRDPTGATRPPLVPGGAAKPIAWVMWWQGLEDMPPLVRACVSSTQERLTGYTVQVLHRDNYADYATVPSAVLQAFESGKMTVTQFTNTVRMTLLRDHGGLWVDATLFFSRPTTVETGEGGLTTRRAAESPTRWNVSAQRWSTYLIGGPPALGIWSFMTEFFEQYWSRHEILVDYHLFDYGLALAYEMDLYNFAEEIDSVPPTQPRIHELAGLLDMPADSSSVTELLRSETTVFKLAWRKAPEPDRIVVGTALAALVARAL